MDRTRQWSKLETLASKWPTLYGTPFLSSEVTVLFDVYIWFYIHLLQDQISLIIFIIMFLHIKIKKSKIYQEFANFCENSLFICFILLVIIFILPGVGVGGGGCPWSYGCWISTSYAIRAYHLWVVRSNPTHGEVCLIQHCVVKFVSDMLQVGCFLWALRFPSPIKLSATIIKIKY